MALARRAIEVLSAKTFLAGEERAGQTTELNRLSLLQDSSWTTRLFPMTLSIPGALLLGPPLRNITEYHSRILPPAKSHPPRYRLSRHMEKSQRKIMDISANQIRPGQRKHQQPHMQQRVGSKRTGNESLHRAIHMLHKVNSNTHLRIANRSTKDMNHSGTITLPGSNGSISLSTSFKPRSQVSSGPDGKILSCDLMSTYALSSYLIYPKHLAVLCNLVTDNVLPRQTFLNSEPLSFATYGECTLNS